MKIYCPNCESEVTLVIIFSAEKKYDTETKEVEWNDLDFNNIECPECYYDFGDERDLPEEDRAVFKELIAEAEKVY